MHRILTRRRSSSTDNTQCPNLPIEKGFLHVPPLKVFLFSNGRIVVLYVEKKVSG